MNTPRTPRIPIHESLDAPYSAKRTSFIRSGVRTLMIGAVLMGIQGKGHSQESPEKKPPPAPVVQPNEDVEKAPSPFERAVQDHPYATVERLDIPKPTSRELRLFALQNGLIRAETMIHLRDTGWIEAMRKERKKERATFGDDPFQENPITPDIEPKNGSGFVFEHEGVWYIGSNVHVTNGAHREMEELMTNDKHTDISVIPGDIVPRCPGDEYPLPVVRIEEDITNEQLPEHKVRVTGMGADLFEVTGKPFHFASHIEDEQEREACKHLLALKVKAEDIGGKANAIIGMSGSRVELTETRRTVGVLHSVTTLPDDSVLLRFSGPNELRETVKKARIDRQRNKARLDIDAVLKRIEAVEESKQKPDVKKENIPSPPPPPSPPER